MYEYPNFRLFWKFAKLAILIGNFMNFFWRMLCLGAILSDHFDRISINEKNLYFWANDQNWSFMIAQRSSLENLVLSPRSKLEGLKRNSRTGQEDGLEKKKQK